MSHKLTIMETLGMAVNFQLFLGNLIRAGHALWHVHAGAAKCHQAPLVQCKKYTIPIDKPEARG